MKCDLQNQSSVATDLPCVVNSPLLTERQLWLLLLNHFCGAVTPLDL